MDRTRRLRGAQGVRAGLLVTLIASLMLFSALMASADPGGGRPSNITWESAPLTFNITWE